MGTSKSPLHDNVSKAMGYYKSLRDKNNKDIADALDIPTTTISAWNTGRHLPDMDRLQKLADYLNAPIGQFFNFTACDTPEIDKELEALYNLIKEDRELRNFLKVYSQLSDEDKTLLTQLANKVLK